MSACFYEHVNNKYFSIFVVTVRYEEIVVRGDESSGVLIFTLVTNEPAMETFTVQVCTRELNDTLGGGPASDGFATG